MDPGPRKPEAVDEQTGAGTPRSADDGVAEPGSLAGNAPDVTAEELSGMQSSSHPAEPNDLDVNRSGSGGSGGPADAPSMEELLTGEDESA